MDALKNVLEETVQRRGARVRMEGLPTGVEAAVKLADDVVAKFLPELKKAKAALQAQKNAPELVGDQKEGVAALLDQLEVGLAALVQVETTVVDLSSDGSDLGLDDEEDGDEENPEWKAMMARLRP
jgi:hypothetical protein